MRVAAFVILALLLLASVVNLERKVADPASWHWLGALAVVGLVIVAVWA